jgi:predicted RND superfamily exporter protein
MYEFARAEDKIAIGQLRGMGFALVAIGVVLYAIFREMRLTFATIVANAAPIVLAFGALGFLRLPLDAGTVVVGNLAIGIAIDETLHLASGLRDLDASGGSREKVLLEALQLCVPSILYTTAAISLGFGVLGLSDFSFTRDLGLLTAAVMVLCVCADLFLLPALVLGPSKVACDRVERSSR